jgi:hypothetical protein
MHQRPYRDKPADLAAQCVVEGGRGRGLCNPSPGVEEAIENRPLFCRWSLLALNVNLEVGCYCAVTAP